MKLAPGVSDQADSLLTVSRAMKFCPDVKQLFLIILCDYCFKVLNELLSNEDGTIEVTTEAQHAAATSSVAFAKRLKALEFVQAYRLSGNYQ